MIRVLVAEDSPTVRQLLIEILESDPEFQVVGHAGDGVAVIEMAHQLRPDLITMDLHMPELDGLAATRRIMAEMPTPILVVSSSSSSPNVRHSMEALEAGALMVVSKPDNPAGGPFEARRREFLAMARAMAGVKVVRHRAAAVSARPALPHPSLPGTVVRLVVIVASTGGPTALNLILSGITADFPVPILVVQHIATGFVGGLADWLAGNCRLPVAVASHDEVLRGGMVRIAPDGCQMGVSSDGRIKLTAEPPVGGFRPSGSYLFESSARAYGPSVVAVILTGMGSDGVTGLRAVTAAGGRVLAQDEATSVVYGMPREAAIAGLTDAVVAVDQLALCLTQLVSRGTYAATNPRR